MIYLVQQTVARLIPIVHSTSIQGDGLIYGKLYKIAVYHLLITSKELRANRIVHIYDMV